MTKKTDKPPRVVWVVETQLTAGVWSPHQLRFTRCRAAEDFIEIREAGWPVRITPYVPRAPQRKKRKRTKKEQCLGCGGSGEYFPNYGGVQKCRVCGGTGRVPVRKAKE